MITLEVQTNYAFIHKLMVAAKLYPFSTRFDVTEHTVADLIIGYLNQNGNNFTLDYTNKAVEKVVLNDKPGTLLTIGTIQCSRAEAMVMKLCHQIPGELELKL